MSEPTDSGGLPSPLDFESGSHRYSIQRPLVSHPDYDTLLLASRQHVRGGPLKRVILKPILLGEERELRARALEEVNLSGFLRHPNIARVLGSAFTEEMAYVVMDMGHGRFLLSIMDAAVSVGSKLSHGFAAEELPEPLRRIVARALRPEPAERYQTAGQLRDELRDFLQGAGQQPYGAKQAKAEVNRLFGEASDLDKLQAYPIVEIGVLPVPPDMDLENLDELDD
ncbi:hypothetical protein ACN28E_05860 [Archangium lansingense]|uniref:hypothetical protein n=1 Tax=Archangium lansingense TaxID=2995310 RepID=UPI003B7DEA95